MVLTTKASDLSPFSFSADSLLQLRALDGLKLQEWSSQGGDWENGGVPVMLQVGCALPGQRLQVGSCLQSRLEGVDVPDASYSGRILLIPRLTKF